MTDFSLYLADVLVLLGTLATTLSISGVIRIPNPFGQIHAAAKGVVIGSTIVLSATLASGDLAMIARAALVAAFLLATSPLASHGLARIASIDRPRPTRAGDGPSRSTIHEPSSTVSRASLRA